MRLLFVKTKNIGDTLLLTPTLAAARQAYPDAEIWVVVRRSTEPMLAGNPALQRLLTTAAPEASQRDTTGPWHDVKLLLQLRRQRFDYAFDLSNGDRGRLLASLSRARVRCTNAGAAPLGIWRICFNFAARSNAPDRHQVQVDFDTVNECLPLRVSRPPPLVYARAAVQPCDLGVPLANYVVLHPGTRWQRKRWPLERWVAVAKVLAETFPRLIISAGPDPDEVRDAAELERALAGQAVSTAGRLNWAQLAGLLYHTRLFVGVDTAAMHLAAACQAPTVALFGPSDERVWHPWQVRHELVSPPEVLPHERRMNDITVEQVLAACRRMAA